MLRFWSVLVFIIMVLAIYDVWNRETSTEKRLLWTVVILFLPLLGALAWLGISRGYIKL
jgi:heme A synthase